MRKFTLLFCVSTLLIFAACSKQKKISKILWKPEGTWNITSSSYEYYSMGNYNTTTSSYEDSLTLSSGNFNGSTYFFDKFDNTAYEGDGTFTTTDTTINFTYFVSEDVDFNTGKQLDKYSLVIENEAAAGSTSQQEFFEIISYDKSKMSLKKVSNSAWSTTPYEVIHSYVTIDMEK